MKHSFYLMVFAVWVAVVTEQAKAAPHSLSGARATYGNLQPLKRVVRQMPPPPDMPPPPPGMPPPPPPPEYASPVEAMDSMARQRREAKGGGSMPTRKG